MKVFKINHNGSYYAYAAETMEAAITQFQEDTGNTVIEEIPESEWDKKRISMYEDNDLEKAHWMVSIRESICGSEPQMIFTNDSAE